MPAKTQPGLPGDRIEVSSPGREQPHRGLIVEVLGGGRHERYRVRWLDGRESIHYPSEGTRIRASEPLETVGNRTLPAAPNGARRWEVEVRDRPPLEVE